MTSGAVRPVSPGLLRHRFGGRPQVRVVLATASAFAVSYVLAFLLRFDFSIPPDYLAYVQVTLPVAILAKTTVFYALGVFRIVWAYVGVSDSLRILQATVLGTAATATLNLLVKPWSITPRSVLLIDALLTFLFVSGLFVSFRLRRESRRTVATELEPVFIVGAGDAGDSLLRELRRNGAGGVRPVAFLDDDPQKIGRLLHGVPVLGCVADATRLAERHRVGRAYVAIPSLSAKELRRIVGELKHARLSIKVLPPMAQLMTSSAMAPQLREVALEDLLRRDTVRPDVTAISRFVQGKVVLVTGAAGSIGSELCRQILGFSPAHLVALDCAETPLHDLMLELLPRWPAGGVAPRLVDVTDREAVRRVFAEHRPEIVFHAAALKHVPMLESHPHRAIQVNVAGTRVVAEAAAASASTFVMISTDKAVRPTSVMGASKRIAERLVRGLNSRAGVRTRHVSVRFGNVLGSNGSVVPIFRKQLARGGPLTVTHPDMRRYFMTIPEAVHLVLQAATLGQGGEVFVLDMGEPVRIVDLAQNLIRLSGFEPEVDIRIEFTGIRPGEKLFEEWSMDSERLSRTAHPKVFQLRSEADDLPWDEILRVESLALTYAPATDLLGAVRALVPDYQDGPTVAEPDPEADPEATPVEVARV